MSARTPRWRWGDPVERIREILAAGGMVAIPTESSYGLAVDPRSAEGVAEVYALKGREASKALALVIADAGQAIALGVDPDAPQLAAVAPLWPAPLSAVLPLAQPLAAAAGGATLAARVPAHPRLVELLRELGFGLTASSANRSGAPPILDPEALDPLLAGRPAIVIDDGVLPGGEPSTVVTWRRDGELHILRHGAYPTAGLATRLRLPERDSD